MGVDDIGADARSYFSKHVVVRYGSAIFDATAGPVLGMANITTYCNAVIDISSSDLSSPFSERRLSQDADYDGFLTTAEIFFTDKSVTGMH